MTINDSSIEREEEKRRLGLAISWLAAQISPHDMKQIEEASQRFDLSPLDEDFLIRQFVTLQNAYLH